MRIIFKKREPGRIEFGIIYGGIALLSLAAARFLPVLNFAPTCVFKGLTGVPCPTCGSTRAIVRFTHGDLAGSLLMNPLVFSALIAALIFFAYSIVTLTGNIPRLSVALSERGKNLARISVVMLFLTNWLYLALTL